MTCSGHPPIPDFVRSHSRANVKAISWSADRAPWPRALKDHPNLRAALEAEANGDGGGIRREFVFKQSDPVELFLAAMAWGFGPTNVRWPKQHAMLLDADSQRDNLTEIIRAVREEGAIAGWRALWGEHHIDGLGPAFGTKLLYYAAYRHRQVARRAQQEEPQARRPRPLILDANVLRALNDVGTGLDAQFRYGREDDYRRYLCLAESWAADKSWDDGAPDLVEDGLFQRGKLLAQQRRRRRKRSATRNCR